MSVTPVPKREMNSASFDIDYVNKVKEDDNLLPIAVGAHTDENYPKHLNKKSKCSNDPYLPY